MMLYIEDRADRDNCF